MPEERKPKINAPGAIERESLKARIDAAPSGRRPISGQPVARGKHGAQRVAAGQQHGRNRRSLGKPMRQAKRLLEMIRSARLQHAMVVLFMMLVLGYGAIALPAIWRGFERSS